MHRVVSFSFSDSDLLQQAFQIRQQVFVEEQQVDRDEEYDGFEETSIHYLVYEDDRPVGTARWRITSGGVKLERFAVLKECRNSGAGKAVLITVLRDVIPLGKRIYLNAQVTAMRFYEREGFIKEGEMFSEANIDHYRMVWQPVARA